MCASGREHLTFEQGLVEALPALRRFAMKLLHRDRSRADDLVQDTVERALRKRHLFDGRNLEGWLFTLMYHKLSDTVRHEARRPAETGKVFEAVSQTVPAPSAGQDLVLDFERALSFVTPSWRRPLRLTCVDERSPTEVARHMRVKRTKVNGKIFLGRRKLRRLLRDWQPTP